MRKVGKLGIIRLTGADLTALRREVWERDEGRCQACGAATYWEARFAGDPLAYDLAHLKSRGAGGSDTAENCRCLCHKDHCREHAHGRARTAQGASEAIR